MSRFVCPDCYAPIQTPKPKRDARCGKCRADLPVNGKKQ